MEGGGPGLFLYMMFLSSVWFLFFFCCNSLTIKVDYLPQQFFVLIFSFSFNMTQSGTNFLTGGSGLKLVTWNCRGINNPIKCSKVLHHLRQLNAQIVFLQETPLNESQHTQLRCRWVDQMYHST